MNKSIIIIHILILILVSSCSDKNLLEGEFRNPKTNEFIKFKKNGEFFYAIDFHGKNIIHNENIEGVLGHYSISNENKVELQVISNHCCNFSIKKLGTDYLIVKYELLNKEIKFTKTEEK